VRVAIVFKRSADTGGSERQVALLARQLAARGDDVHLFCASVRSGPPAGVTAHVMPYLLPGRLLGLLAFSSWARRAVERHGPFDVRHAFGRSVGQDVYRLGGGCHRTYLEHAHALDRPAWLRPLLRRMPYQLVKLGIERRLLSAASTQRIIANSSMVRDDLLFRYGLDPARVRVVPNGTDLARFRPAVPGERDELRRELGLAAESEVVLFLGSGFARKGLDPTLRALARLAPARPRLQLLVAGRDRSPARWKALAAQLGVAQRVWFLGPRPDPERLYRAADVFALPTAYDPAANCTLEALASGLPVITSATNGAAEILRPDQHGTVVPAPVHPGDVVDALAVWLERAGAPGVTAACRARAEEFPAEASCAATVEVYLEIIAAQHAASAEVR
jgi:UDP-glucose:(heptosyl)LPS alpha-1,3-glucosyltransferase